MAGRKKTKITTDLAVVRTTNKLVHDDKTLKALAAQGAHDRHQTLLKAINALAIILIYLFVVGIIIWMVILCAHYVQTGDWQSLERRGDVLAVALISYLISYLQSHGISRND